jgi:hypothetical protein
MAKEIKPLGKIAFARAGPAGGKVDRNFANLPTPAFDHEFQPDLISDRGKGGSPGQDPAGDREKAG